MGADKKVICALRGCGREVRRDKVHKWKLRLKRNLRASGPFCSQECYHDYRKT
jgi:hypothetical protein